MTLQFNFNAWREPDDYSPNGDGKRPTPGPGPFSGIGNLNNSKAFLGLLKILMCLAKFCQPPAYHLLT